jgi:hypothetical protein
VFHLFPDHRIFSFFGDSTCFTILSLIKNARGESIPNHEKFQQPREDGPPEHSGAGRRAGNTLHHLFISPTPLKNIVEKNEAGDRLINFAY